MNIREGVEERKRIDKEIADITRRIRKCAWNSPTRKKLEDRRDALFTRKVDILSEMDE